MNAYYHAIDSADNTAEVCQTCVGRRAAAAVSRSNSTTEGGRTVGESRSSVVSSPTTIPLSLTDVRVSRNEVQGELRESDWLTFLDGLCSGDGEISHTHRAHIDAVWGALKHDTQVPLPYTQLTSHGSVQLAWNLGGRHLELEVFEDGSLEWFFRDKDTNKFDGTKDDRTYDPPAQFLSYLKQFAG